MKVLQLLVIFAAVAVDATKTRRLRRSVRGGAVNERYIDLAAEIDESVRERVARRVQKHDAKAAKKENAVEELRLQSMSVDAASMSFSMGSRVDMSMSMSLSMSMGLRVDPKDGEPKNPKEVEFETEADAELSMSLSLSLSMV